MAVKHVFSCGHLLLSHVQSQLSAQTTHALLCLGEWSWLGLVKDSNMLAVAVMPDVSPKECAPNDDFKLPDAWDAINISQ